MRWSVAGLVALILVAGLVIAIRSFAFTSSSCQASAQGVGIPGSPPPYTPPTGLQAQGQPHAPLMTPINTPHYKGTPPPGFASWDDFTQYIFSHVQAIPPSTAVTNFGGSPSVGGESKLTGC
jgi:hypothetical protein